MDKYKTTWDRMGVGGGIFAVAIFFHMEAAPLALNSPTSSPFLSGR